MRHKANGGKTSTKGCVLLCFFHHQVVIHRWGWILVPADAAALGIDLDPPLAEVMEVRDNRMALVRGIVDGLTDAGLERVCPRLPGVLGQAALDQRPHLGRYPVQAGGAVDHAVQQRRRCPGAERALARGGEGEDGPQAEDVARRPDFETGGLLGDMNPGEPITRPACVRAVNSTARLPPPGCHRRHACHRARRTASFFGLLSVNRTAPSSGRNPESHSAERATVRAPGPAPSSRCERHERGEKIMPTTRLRVSLGHRWPAGNHPVPAGRPARRGGTGCGRRGCVPARGPAGSARRASAAVGRVRSRARGHSRA